MSLHAPTFIAAKRDNQAHSDDQIRQFVRAITAQSIDDSQISAWAMAVYFNGLNSRETATLTAAMAQSGTTLEHPDGPAVIDKHSTGGIGDKTSLILAPLLACGDFRVPMISGRGLGITGGTLDKLEAIPGYQTQLSPEQAAAQLAEIQLYIIGQSPQICPADRHLYALRDATATVPSQELIVASIMSKKLAENLDRLILDVKFGNGAFMKTRAQAQQLADSLTRTGNDNHVHTEAILSPMDHPLGNSVGNALEVIEALQILQNNGDPQLTKLILQLAAKLTQLPESQLQTWLQDGSALGKFHQLIHAQGGNPDQLDQLVDIHRAPVIQDIPAPHSGTLIHIDAAQLGQSSLLLGAGRSRPSDQIDPRVGFDQIHPANTPIRAGQALARVHASTPEEAKQAIHQIQQASTIQ